MLSVVYSEKFISQFEKLSPKLQKLAYTKVAIFCANSKNPSLKTHKLGGVLEGFLSFSVDYQTRIVFEYGKLGVVHFLKIGNHGVYK